LKDSITFIAPFRAGREFDTPKLIHDLEHDRASVSKAREKLISGLDKTTPYISWDAMEGVGLRHKKRIEGYERGTASSKRPLFAVSGIVEPESELWKSLARFGGVELELKHVKLVYQDFGVGVILFRYHFSHKEIAKSGVPFTEICNRITDHHLDDIQKLVEDQNTAFLKALKMADDYVLDESSGILRRHFHMTGDVAPPAPGKLYWFHHLTTLKASGRASKSFGNEDWYRRTRELGYAPKVGHFSDDVLHYREVEPVPVSDGNADAYLALGWGASLMAVQRIRKGAEDVFDASESLDKSLMIAQAFCAGLFELNRFAISETSELLQGLRDGRLRDYRDFEAQIADHQFSKEMFINLMQEQNYCLNSLERAIWEGAAKAWDFQSQLDQVTESIRLLHHAAEKRREQLDQTIRQRVSNAVTVITVASAAAIFFDMLSDYHTPIDLEGAPNWELIAAKGLILMVLLVLGAFLFLSPRK
jgi:hypothetical protein